MGGRTSYQSLIAILFLSFRNLERYRENAFIYISNHSANFFLGFLSMQKINVNRFYTLKHTALILIFQLLVNLANRIRISNRTKFEPNQIQLPDYSIKVRIRFEFNSILGAFSIRIRFAKFAKR